jgi:hypothetical protein
MSGDLIHLELRYRSLAPTGPHEAVAGKTASRLSVEIERLNLPFLTYFAEFPIRRAVGMDSDGAVAPICCC